MKIIFLCRYFFPHTGGVEKHVLEVGKRLVKMGHQLSVLTSKESLNNVTNLQISNEGNVVTKNIQGIKIYYFDSGKVNKLEKFKVWKELLRLKEHIKNSDIIHCHDVFYWYLPFKLLYPNKKVFLTFHGYEGNKLPNKNAILMHKISEKLSDGNICIGDFFKKWYQTRPTFISFGATKKRKNIYMKNNKNNIKAMFLGRLEDETGIMDYLIALKKLRDKKINIKLDIYGNGSLEKKAKQFTKNNKLNISFKNFINNADEYILNYEMIFTSRYLGILEALSFKKYILAVYNNEIKKDYLTMTPFSKFISILANSDEIVNSIEKYIKNSNEFESKINAGFIWSGKQTWEKLVNLYFKLWKLR